MTSDLQRMIISELRSRILSADELAWTLGRNLSSIRNNLSMLGSAGLAISRRAGLPAYWTIPERDKELRSFCRKRNQARKREIRLTLSRGRRKGPIEGDDDGVIQRTVSKWRKPVKLGPASVWELAS